MTITLEMCVRGKERERGRERSKESKKARLRESEREERREGARSLTGISSHWCFSLGNRLGADAGTKRSCQVCRSQHTRLHTHTYSHVHKHTVCTNAYMHKQTHPPYTHIKRSLVVVHRNENRYLCEKLTRDQPLVYKSVNSERRSRLSVRGTKQEKQLAS